MMFFPAEIMCSNEFKIFTILRNVFCEISIIFVYVWRVTVVANEEANERHHKKETNHTKEKKLLPGYAHKFNNCFSFRFF